MRPTGAAILLFLGALMAAVVLLLPPEQRLLAVVLSLGLGGSLAALARHVLALTRWTRRIELDLRELSARFEAYSAAADLNIGRSIVSQASTDEALQRAVAEVEQLPALTRRLSDLEGGVDRVSSRLNAVETSNADAEARAGLVEAALRELRSLSSIRHAASPGSIASDSPDDLKDLFRALESAQRLVSDTCALIETRVYGQRAAPGAAQPHAQAAGESIAPRSNVPGTKTSPSRAAEAESE